MLRLKALKGGVSSNVGLSSLSISIEQLIISDCQDFTAGVGSVEAVAGCRKPIFKASALPSSVRDDHKSPVRYSKPV